jgi:hypothetical protein
MVDIVTLTSRRSRFGISLPLVFGLLSYAATLGWGRRTLSDPDTYWHIAVGRWILAHHAVPHQGIFSYSMPDAPWVAHEWLSELLIAIVYDHLGWGGLLVATGLAAAAAVSLLLRLLLRWLEPAQAMIATALGWDLAFFHLLARPHVFSLVILIFWAGALVKARSEGRAPSPWLLPLVVLWANLHASYMLGLVLAGLFAVEAVLEAGDWPARLAAARAWGLFAVGALAAALITPFGIEGLLLPFALMGMKFTMSIVAEWRSPNFQPFHPLELWLAIVLAGAISFGWRLPPMRTLILLLFLHMALQHQRYIDVLGLVAPIVMAPALGPLIAARVAGRAASSIDRAAVELAKPARPGALALGAAVLLAVTAAALRPGVAPEAHTPTAALAAVAAAHIEGPVLNDYSFGGYLIFAGIPPMIDGRNEVYGDAFVERYAKATQLLSDQLPALLDEYRITWTLLEPVTPANILLDHLPGWRRLYADDTAVVHVRDGRTPQ